MIDLRMITEKDTENIIKWRNNPNVLKNFIDRRPLTKENHEQWLLKYVNTGKVVQFIIVNTENNEGIGSVFLKDIDYAQGNAEFGIFIGEDAQRGKGAGSIAIQKIKDYARNNLHLKSLFLRVLRKNSQAIHTYKKVGFQETEKSENVIIQGIEEEIVFMSILL